MIKIVTIIIFILCYSLAISRKVKLAYISPASAVLLLLFGILSPKDAFSSVKWNVLGIYWGFMMVSMVFAESKMPSLIVNKIIKYIRKEKYFILALCAITAFLSAFMENVGVVLMMAPVAIEAAKKMKIDLFKTMIAVAISANVVTTLTMVADPPSIILASETGMKFFDFYWFQGKIGLGAITLFGVVAALLTLLFTFRKLNTTLALSEEKIQANYFPTVLFIVSVLGLAFLPEFGIQPGFVGLAAGLISLFVYRNKAMTMMREFDWNSFFFIIGIFIVIGSLKTTGLLDDFAHVIGSLGISNATLMLLIVTFISMAASSFIDNVPWTVLMIPVCMNIASLIHVSPFPLLYGMLIGTGIGGNITPVGATANVFACGILEKQGYKIKLKEYVKISLPFSLVAVVVAVIFLQIFWL